MSARATATTVGQPVVVVRAAADLDAEAMAAIYNQGIADGEATFDTESVAAADTRAWLGDDRQPVLVAESDGRVLGWARVIQSSERCALAGVGEYMLYLDRSARGRGVGTKLLDALVTTAERSGCWKLQGRLFTTNSAYADLDALVDASRAELKCRESAASSS